MTPNMISDLEMQIFVIQIVTKGKKDDLLSIVKLSGAFYNKNSQRYELARVLVLESTI